MPFDRTQVSTLLVECHRRCCICHRFCGVKMETDHIIPKDDQGTDDIENAIPVCFECHAEIHSYNERHPRGRKYTSEELKQHKEQWLRICKEKPATLIRTNIRSDVGPLQALIDELEFNSRVAEFVQPVEIGCLFKMEQFSRAIEQGSIATMKDELKSSMLDAYVKMGNANQHISAALGHEYRSDSRAEDINHAQKVILIAKPKIKKAIDDLMSFLGSE
jgi:hypothetical protein